MEIKAEINTEAEEKLVFDKFKEWLLDNFQKFKMSVLGKELNEYESLENAK